MQAGPQLSYLLNKETLLSNGGNGRVFNYNSFDLSLAFGAEYEFQHFFLFGRYHAGLNRIVNASDIQTHNLVIQAGIGFLF